MKCVILHRLLIGHRRAGAHKPEPAACKGAFNCVNYRSVVELRYRYDHIWSNGVLNLTETTHVYLRFK